MTSREFNALVQRYTEEIKNEFSAGILNYNKDGKIKKSKLLPRDITNGTQRRIQAEGKTVAQCAVATIGTSAVMGEVDWVMVASASALAGIVSLLTSVAGLPELDK